MLGHIAPGARIPLYELAAEYGISRVPLREAMRQLEAEGLVDHTPRRGTVVRPLTQQDLQDCFDLLEHIESIAAVRAAAQTSPAMIADMRQWFDRMDQLQDHWVSEDMLQAHRNFHFAYFDALGDGVLLRIVRMLWHTCQRYVMHCAPDAHQIATSRAQHLELISLLECADGAGATALLVLHIRQALEYARAFLADEAATGPEVANAAVAGTDGQPRGA